MAAAGIRGASAAYVSAPVWGRRRPFGPTERMSMATAPWRAARDAPFQRYREVSP